MTKEEQVNYTSRWFDALPRMTPDGYPKVDTNAWVFIDASGNLVMLMANGDKFTLGEHRLGAFRLSDGP